MREVPEWKGKTDDTPLPARVKLRIFERFQGRCNNCTGRIGGKLTPAYDHEIALINGGENKESNFQLLCSPCHLVKTKLDVAEKAQVYHKRIKAIGIKRKKRTIPGRKFDGTPIPPKWK